MGYVICPLCSRVGYIDCVGRLLSILIGLLARDGMAMGLGLSGRKEKRDADA